MTDEAEELCKSGKRKSMKRIVLFIMIAVTILYGLSSCIVREQPSESGTPPITPSMEESDPSLEPTSTEESYPVFDPPWYTTLEIGQELRLTFDTNQPEVYKAYDPRFDIFKEGEYYSAVSLVSDNEKGVDILISVIVFNKNKELIYAAGKAPCKKIDLSALEEDLDCDFQSIVEKYGATNCLIGSGIAKWVYITEDAYVVIFGLMGDTVVEIIYTDITNNDIHGYIS